MLLVVYSNVVPQVVPTTVTIHVFAESIKVKKELGRFVLALHRTVLARSTKTRH